MINAKYQLAGHLAINLTPLQPAAFNTEATAIQSPAIAVKHSPKVDRTAGQKPNLRRSKNWDAVVL